MRSTIGRLLLAVWLAGVAPTALAEAPDPYASVPPERAAQSAAAGTDRVFGGQPVADGQYPFQVALLKSDELGDTPKSQYNAQFCGGALIAPTWVLTAAHCMNHDDKPLGPHDFVVLAGSTDLEAGQRVLVKSIVVNEQYDENSMDHDAALVELATPVLLPPVQLDFGTSGTITPTAAIRNATVVGWGMDEDGDYPRYLLETQLDLVPNDECNSGIKAVYAAELKTSLGDLAKQFRIKSADADRIGDELATAIATPLTTAMLCAGLKSGRRDACYGDSGGPLLATVGGRLVEIGIVSWGEGPPNEKVKCGHQDLYGVYSRVASFEDWILSHVQIPPG